MVTRVQGFFLGVVFGRENSSGGNVGSLSMAGMRRGILVHTTLRPLDP